MKSILNSVFGLLVAALLMSNIPEVSAQATSKIAIIDLKKIFEGFYKTKHADSQLKERATDSEKVLKGMLDDYQKSNEDYRKLIDSANDQAVSIDERDKRKKTAEGKLLEIQELEKSVTQFRRQTTENLETQKRRLRDQILKEIREVVNTHAKSGNYSMVFDTAAESINATPILLYTNGQNDITQDVLTDLNKNAPAGALNAAEPAPQKLDAPRLTEPAPSKSDKKK